MSKVLTEYESSEQRWYVYIKIRLTGVTWLKVKRRRIPIHVTFQDRSLNLTVTGELGDYKLALNDKELNKDIIGDCNPTRSVWRRRYCRYKVIDNYIILILRKKDDISWKDRNDELILVDETSEQSSLESEKI
ncbi:uncharacterized protein LOC102800614 [Saccoglossus kowalevskii]|uniref:Uncharacterized protein LOC102800614 n=1 Tax=Saccoglossus kowalevskii TaxID=10224 RepID=A0ABM0M1S9_SACKO|nr:PREDICTED: uncharacterized protein LOC102800614 [Saccoglossus kowalevskii]